MRRPYARSDTTQTTMSIAGIGADRGPRRYPLRFAPGASMHFVRNAQSTCNREVTNGDRSESSAAVTSLIPGACAPAQMMSVLGTVGMFLIRLSAHGQITPKEGNFALLVEISA
jgi:hypothetical protein